MAKRSFRMRRGINITRVVAKIATTILALYVGGTIVNEIGAVILDTSSPFYKGLSLIGWTVNSTGGVTSVTGSGILAVVGIIGIASIVMEFVEFRL